MRSGISATTSSRASFPECAVVTANPLAVSWSAHISASASSSSTSSSLASPRELPTVVDRWAGRRGGKAQGEGAALARTRLHHDVAAQGSGEVPREMQPEPRTLDARGHGRVETSEWLKQLGHLLLRDADALVDHVNGHRSRLRAHGDGDRALRSRVLHRI